MNKSDKNIISVELEPVVQIIESEFTAESEQAGTKIHITYTDGSSCIIYVSVFQYHIMADLLLRYSNYFDSSSEVREWIHR